MLFRSVDVPATAIGIPPCNREPQPKPEKAVSVARSHPARRAPRVGKTTAIIPPAPPPRTDESDVPMMDATIGTRFQTADRTRRDRFAHWRWPSTSAVRSWITRDLASRFGRDPSSGNDADNA